MRSKIPLKINETEFKRFRDLLRDRTGLHFSAQKKEMLALYIAERLASTGLATCSAYYDLLTDTLRGNEEMQKLVNLLSVQETSFFRYNAQFNVLRHIILPEIVGRRSTEARRSLNIWSAGCATGEEPFTIAIILKEAELDPDEWDISVVATDISTEALARAERGIYKEKSLSSLDPRLREKYFSKTAGGFEITEAIRKLVKFRYHNLSNGDRPEWLAAMDVVFCRNVTIYFDEETTRRAIQQLAQAIRPGGFLFLGHAETLWEISDDFHHLDIENAFFYVRKESAPDVPAIAPQQPSRQPREKPVAPSSEKDVPPRLAARHAIARGDFEQAVDGLKDILRTAPLDTEAHYLLGSIYARHRDFPMAIAQLQKSLYCDASFGPASIQLAQVYEAVGRARDAAREYRHLLRSTEAEYDRWKGYLEGISHRTLRRFAKTKIIALTTGARNGRD